jgi:hypothetical protein
VSADKSYLGQLLLPFTKADVRFPAPTPTQPGQHILTAGLAVSTETGIEVQQYAVIAL